MFANGQYSSDFDSNSDSDNTKCFKHHNYNLLIGI